MDDELNHPASVPKDELDPRERSGHRRKKKKKKKKNEGDDDDETSTGDDCWGIKIWEELEQGLPEVLPTEILGWLMLCRSSLSSQQRLNVLSSISNSLVQRTSSEGFVGQRMNFVFMKAEAKKGAGKKGRANAFFWVEQGGE